MSFLCVYSSNASSIVDACTSIAVSLRKSHEIEGEPTGINNQEVSLLLVDVAYTC